MSANGDSKNIEAAKQYVDKQLETMKKYGSAPNDFSDEEYQSLVEEIAETINLK